MNLFETFSDHLDNSLGRLHQIKVWLKDESIRFLLDDLSKQLEKTGLHPYTFNEHYGPFINIAIPDLPHFSDERLDDLLRVLVKHDPTQNEQYDVPMRRSRMFEFKWIGPNLNGFAPLLTVSVEAVLK